MSLAWLERAAPTLGGPWSLAWSILALAAYRRPIDPLLESLSQFPDLNQIEDTSTLALGCLALDWRSGLAALGVGV